MNAEAWGAHHHEKDHLLANHAKFTLGCLSADGVVSVTFRTDRPFGVNGEYYVRVTFEAAEIDQLYRRSIAGTTCALIEKKSP